ncbi:hypothetical protein A3770_03p20060 [Chloropicon primus]|uniref:Deleted in lung and esophageal cancer protein 1 Ig-like domain-containing protein n=2 Tax=Chloropicon primus TaxID=1764295 RepID=A0A5B8MFP6_9CHLO|nr:hypothetical protein A3770_03p20060 [Chloropicon primus]|eukprot:QDZ19488.1 hypothetical protein A3770_03p20060 [Chloropicon primus]
MTETEVETGTEAQAPVQTPGVGPLSLDSSSNLTQEIYSVFVDSFPDLFAEPAAEEEEQGAGEGGEGDAEGGESPAKGPGSPAKSVASGDEGKEEGEGDLGEGSPSKPEEEEEEVVDLYEGKIQLVNKTCEDFVSYVCELEGHLKLAEQRAKEAEDAALSKADELYTPQWRDTGLPEMPSFLTSNLSEGKLESMNLLNPQSLWETILQARDAKSAPPKTIEYFENEAKGYLKTTNNLKVRSRMLDQYPRKVTYKSFSGLTDEQLIKKARESERRLKELSQKMSAAQWDEEVKILQRMKQKLNYTQNPRYLESKKVPKSLKKGSEKAPSLFKVEPNNIEFLDYELGGMYLMEIRVRNVSGLSRRARFLPPRSKYFSIANVQFPGSKNLLAPGMCCKCELYFMPDSLADYDDFFSIETDVSNFQVQVAARRPSPNLSVPKAFDCGPCLLGHTLVTEFQCLNSGGRGSFTVVPEEDWPNTEMDVSTSGPIDLVPFTFEPSSFKLYTGDETTIKIGFLPQESGNFIRKFKMLCDNCKIETFSIVGLGVKLDITLESVDGKPVFEDEEAKQRASNKENVKGLVPFERKVWFGEVVPGAKHPRTVVVRNNTPIPLAYHWVLVDNGYSMDGSGKSKNIFQISPMSGVLGAHENSEFMFVFEPHEIETYMYGAQLMIESHSHTSEGSLLSKVIELDLEGSGKGVNIEVSPALLEFSGTMLFGKQYERNVTISNHSKAPAHFSWKNLPPNVKVFPQEALVPPEDAIECDITVLASDLGRTDITIANDIEHGPQLPLRLVYNVDGPKIKFLAPQIDFGLVEETKEVEASFELQNCSDAQAEFVLKEFDLPSRASKDWVFKFSEDSGVLEPNERKAFVLSCTCSSAQALRTIISCQVMVGNVVCSQQKITVRADVVAPYACLSTTEIDVGVTYLNVAVERTVKIHNLTQLPSHYCWMPEDVLSEDDADKLQILVSPQKGTISPGKTEEFDIEMIPRSTGSCNVILPCELSGMEEPLGLQITTEIEGISVKYEIRGNDNIEVSEDDGKELRIDFGQHLPIGRRASMALIIHNQSAIRAPVDIVFENFGLSQEEILASDQLSHSMGTGNMSEMMLRSSDMVSLVTKVPTKKRKVQMSKTLTAKALETVLLSDSVIGKIDSKLSQDKDKALLREAGNRGVVFLANPMQTTLEPWGSTEFQITCTNNMCGTYFDTLHCEIGGLPCKSIPVKAGVIGSPLALQSQVYTVEKTVDNRSLSINWGDLCVASAAEKRKFWVSNTSSFDMKVDWTVSLLGETDSGNEDTPAFVDFVAKTDGGVQVAIEEKGKNLDGELPFKLLPKSLVIPAGSVKGAEIEFAGTVPRVWEAVIRGKQHIQFSEPSEESVGANLVGSFHPFAAPPCEPLGSLRLNLLANTIQPRLDTQGLEQLKFTCHSCVPGDDASYKKSLAFTNLQSTTVMCRIVVEGPYKIVSVVTSYPQPATDKKGVSKVFVIPPSENVDVTLQYEKQKMTSEPEGLFENIDGFLKILYLPQSGPNVLEGAATVCVQEFPMQTKLLYPKIALSQDNISFDNVHPNAPKVIELTLTNPTIVDAMWSITELEESKPRKLSSSSTGTRRLSNRVTVAEKAKPVFEIAPTSGMIRGRGIGQPQQQKITIRFHPQHDLEYKRQYRVRVKKGLGTFFALKGCGSYNEVLESDLALSLS